MASLTGSFQDIDPRVNSQNGSENISLVFSQLFLFVFAALVFYSFCWFLDTLPGGGMVLNLEFLRPNLLPVKLLVKVLDPHQTRTCQIDKQGAGIMR